MSNSNKVAVVVGAGPGIGLAVAIRFAKEGFKIGLVSRKPVSEAELRAAVPGVDVVSAAANAADPAESKQALATIIEKLGEPTVLVYNAAVLRMRHYSELTVDNLVEEFKVNVAGAVVWVNLVVPYMKTRQSGTILLTGGGFGLKGVAAFASLSMGKAAIRNFAQALFADLEPAGIHAATVTVAALVKPGTASDPNIIAEEYWRLHSQEKGKWQDEIVFRV